MRSNPAQRLHDLLTEFKAKQPGIPIARAIGEVLDFDPDDAPVLFSAVAAISALPYQIELQLERTPDIDHELFVSPWMSKVSAVIEQLHNVGNPVQNVTQQYDDAVLLGLRHASHALRLTGHELPTDTEVSDLLAALNDLETQVFAADDLDGEVRDFLLRHINDMRRALQLVKVHGVEGFQNAVAATAGDAVLRQIEGKPVPNPESPIGQQFNDVMTKAGLLITFSNGLIELGTKIGHGIAQILP
jgi:hypothetical protein